MKRFAIGLGLAALLALPGSALGFHHGGLSSTTCSAPAAGDPSNDNGNAKEALTAAGVFSPGNPLPPVGTPGNGKGQGDENCANAPAP